MRDYRASEREKQKKIWENTPQGIAEELIQKAKLAIQEDSEKIVERFKATPEYLAATSAHQSVLINLLRQRMEQHFNDYFERKRPELEQHFEVFIQQLSVKLSEELRTKASEELKAKGSLEVHRLFSERGLV